MTAATTHLDPVTMHPSPAPHPESPSPADLARRARLGCADSFDSLARRYLPRLLVVLEKRLGRSHDAEDVAQEALTRAFQHIDTYDDRYCFSTWLFTIALRLASDHARRQRIRNADPITDDHRWAAPDPAADVQASDREEAANIWAAARKALPAPQFTALWLRYAEAMSVREIASAMHRSVVGVRVLLHRGRHLLGKQLAGEFAPARSADAKTGSRGEP